MLPPSTHVACNKRYRDKKDNVAKGKQSIQYRKQTETYITKNQHVERLEQNIIWRVLSVSRTNACTAKFENKIIANGRMLNQPRKNFFNIFNGVTCKRLSRYVAAGFRKDQPHVVIVNGLIRK